MQRQLRCREPGECAGLGSSPSEAPAGEAGGAHGVSRLRCEAVLAGGDVSKSMSPALEEAEGAFTS